MLVVYVIFSMMLCWLFFVLFLRSNRAALHAVFILNGAKKKCFATMKVVAKKYKN
jgi:hypothetical protein